MLFVFVSWSHCFQSDLHHMEFREQFETLDDENTLSVYCIHNDQISAQKHQTNIRLIGYCNVIEKLNQFPMRDDLHAETAHEVHLVEHNARRIMQFKSFKSDRL